MYALFPHNEGVQVYPEDFWRCGIEGELLEKGSLNECIGLHTLGLLNGDLQPITTDETGGHLYF